MKFSILKTLRVVVALLFFVPIVLFFCDFADVLPGFFKQLMRIQVVPAILAGSLITIFVLAFLTILLGRVYCSTICPLGILQDFISRISKRGKKKNKKKRWFHYSKPQHYLRYGLLGICVVLFVFGIITPLLLLDPYSNFGRIATNLFRPMTIWTNNLINAMAVKAGNFNFYHVSIHTITMVSLISGITALVVVGVMSFLRGRLFCNTICPVGSLLGLFSRFSVFRIVMDEKKCAKCTLCERACKSQCIDSKNMKVDSSRCVSCFNCLSRCKHNAIDYKFTWKKTSGVVAVVPTEQQPQTVIEDTTLQTSRRTFLATGAAVAATIPFIPAWAKNEPVDESKLTPVTPPGSKSLRHFKEKCTGCHLCVTHCPQQILKPAGLSFGFGYLLKPHMVYDRAYCNYECDICSKVCPNGAIVPFKNSEDKKTTQVGIALYTEELCVVYTDETDCGACSEHCPTQAVRMIPYKGDLRIPHVTPDLCVGCGGCEYICPVRPLRAINVVANSVHQVAHKPKEEEIEHVKVDDFGF